MERNVSMRLGARNSSLAILLAAVLAALIAATAPNAAYADESGNDAAGQPVLPIAADWEDDEDSLDAWVDEDCDDGQDDEEWDDERYDEGDDWSDGDDWDDEWCDDPDGDSDDGDWWLDDDSEWDQDVVWLYDDEGDDSWADDEWADDEWADDDDEGWWLDEDDEEWYDGEEWLFDDEDGWESDWSEGEDLLAGGWLGDWEICYADGMEAAPGCIAICSRQGIPFETGILTGAQPATLAAGCASGSPASAMPQAIVASRDDPGSSVQGAGLAAGGAPTAGIASGAPGLKDAPDAEGRACQLGELPVSHNAASRAAASSIGGRIARVIQPVLEGYAVKPE